jgi:hypothetical protein
MNLMPPDTTRSVVHQTVIALDRLWDADIYTPIIILRLHNVATFTLHIYYVSLQAVGHYLHILVPSFNLPALLTLLNTKRRPLYLKTQSVPRCKHFSSGL